MFVLLLEDVEDIAAVLLTCQLELDEGFLHLLILPTS